MGTDYIQGYFIGLGNNSVLLGKQNYSWKELTRKTVSVTAGNTYRLRVDAVGANIKVYLDGELVIDYTDPDPWISGSVGYRAHQSPITADNFKVTEIK